MFGLFGKKPKPTGCNSCKTKTAENCNSHLSLAALQIAQVFIDNKRSFDPNHQKDKNIVSEMLTTTLTDERGKAVSYQIPQTPELQRWFYGLIKQQVANGLKNAGPAS